MGLLSGDDKKYVSFGAGETIIHQGSEPQTAYLIKKGEVKVTNKDGAASFEVAKLGPGQVVGEMALIKGYHRHSAQVTAVSDVTLVPIAAREINKMLAKTDPMIVRILGSLVERLYNETFVKRK